MAKPTPVPWSLIAAAVVSGTMTMRQAAARFNIPFGTIAARSAREGWFKSTKPDKKKAGDSLKPGSPDPVEPGIPAPDGPYELVDDAVDPSEPGDRASGDHGSNEMPAVSVERVEHGIRDAGDHGIRESAPLVEHGKPIVPHANNSKAVANRPQITEKDVIQGIADAIRENRDKFKGTVARKLAKVADHIEDMDDSVVIEKADKIKSLAQAGKEVWGEQEKAPAQNLMVSFSFLTDTNAPAPIDIDAEVI